MINVKYASIPSETVVILTRKQKLSRLEDLYPLCQYFVIKELSKKGYNVILINYTRRLSKPKLLDENVLVFSVPYVTNIYALSSSIASYILTLLKKTQLLYIEAWPIRNLYGLLPLFYLARKNGAKIVSDLYDLYFVYEISIVHSMFRKYKHLYKIYGRLWQVIYNNIDYVFFVSKEAAEVAKKIFRNRFLNYKILFYGVDTGVFYYKHFKENCWRDFNGQEPTICWIGNNAVKKRLPETIIHINKTLGGKVKFIIGGKIKDCVIKHLKEKVETLKYVGPTSYEESAKIYCEECNIIIAPTDPSLIHNHVSIYEKPLQALLLGIPTVFTLGLATYNYLRKELNIKEHHGYIAVRNNAYYGKAIKYIIENYDLMKKSAYRVADEIVNKISRQILARKRVETLINILQEKK